MIHLSSINQLNSSLVEREIALANTKKQFGEPGVLLQTCNRIEFYSGEGNVPAEVSRHLFRVVSGLESSLFGEIAIQGQVKTAYNEALQKNKLNKGLHFLFQTALYVGKRVRSETDISRGAMSYSQAAAEIILQSGINLNKALISLIGVHKLNEDIIRFLQYRGAETIFLASKSFDKAEVVAQKYNCTVMKLDQLKEILKFSDVIISATSAPHLIVKYEDFPKDRKMLIIDLAFPRDVDERIGQLPEVTLYNIEDVEHQVNQNIQKRNAKVEMAESIIEEEVSLFVEKQDKQLHYVQNIAT